MDEIEKSGGGRDAASPFNADFEHSPIKRRFWLLRHALSSGSSMVAALRTAEEAEAFLLTGAAPCASSGEPTDQVSAADIEDTEKRFAAQHATLYSAAPTVLLEPEKKAAITARLEAGADNGQLACEFGLTPRQVQGFRMQVARRGKRSNAAAGEPLHASSLSSLMNSPWTDAVVRYLRQQDDVIVAEGPGSFLVNNRFRLDYEQMLHRANRMRQRQGKPEFQIGEHLTPD